MGIDTMHVQYMCLGYLGGLGFHRVHFYFIKYICIKYYQCVRLWELESGRL